MKISERILLVVLMLILIAMCIFGALFVCDFIPVLSFAFAMNQLWIQIIAVLAALCISLLAIRCMWIATGNKKEQKKPAQSATLSVSASGDVRIAQEAVSTFCEQAAKEIIGVQNAKCKLTQKETEIFIEMILQAGLDAKLVELAANVQNNIKEMLASSCGITNASIHVLFEKKPL